MTLVGTLAALGMAFGAPFIYADQAWSIQKRRNAEGFSKDVCAVLIIANICRIFFWFGERFEWALLLQSILLVVSQFYLLHLLLKFRPGSFASSSFSVASGDRSRQPQQASQRVAAPRSQSTNPTVTDFSADNDDDDDAERHAGNETQQGKSTSTQGPAFTALFGGTSAAKYAPLFGNVDLPIAPTLDDDDDEGTSRQRSHGNGFLARVREVIVGGLRRQEGSTRRDGSSGGRPFGFWTWPNFSSYLVFTGILIIALTILQLLLGWSRLYVGLLGFFALGLEATLPIPQALKNWQRKSLSGFRITVLIGWTGGDLFKNGYYIAAGSPLQFPVCGFFTLVVDVIICAQLYMYREQTARDDDELRLAEAEALEAGQREQAPIEDDGVRGNTMGQSQPSKSKQQASFTRGPLQSEESSRFQIEADDEDDDDDADIGRQRR